MRKLTKEEVKIMVQLFNHDKFKDQQIADLFGVSRRYVNHVRNGFRLSSLTGILPVSVDEKNNKDFWEALDQIEKSVK